MNKPDAFDSLWAEALTRELPAVMVANWLSSYLTGASPVDVFERSKRLAAGIDPGCLPSVIDDADKMASDRDQGDLIQMSSGRGNTPDPESSFRLAASMHSSTHDMEGGCAAHESRKYRPRRVIGLIVVTG